VSIFNFLFERVLFFSGHFGILRADFLKCLAVFEEQFSQLILLELVVIGCDLIEASSDQLSFIFLYFGCFDIFAGLVLKFLFSGKVFLLPFSNRGSEITTSVVVVRLLVVVMLSSRVVVVVVGAISLLLLVVLDLTILETSE